MKITRKDFIMLTAGATAGYAMPPRIGGGRRWYKGVGEKEEVLGFL